MPRTTPRTRRQFDLREVGLFAVLVAFSAAAWLRWYQTPQDDAWLRDSDETVCQPRISATNRSALS